ncbi:MAG: phospholipase D-like domain-containing protein [Opitutus sp.]
MPLFEKISRHVPHRRTLTPEQAKRRPKHDLQWHWAFVVLGIAMLLGAYFWYVSARIVQEPMRISFGPSDPAFSAAMGPLLGADFAGGNSVQTLVNGDNFFPPMLEAIRGAKKTITLETYIWSSGQISDRFIAALSERAKAGVKIHILLDGMGTLHFKDEDKKRLTDSGAEVYKYGRQHWYEIKPNINHRTHRKILVVDGHIGFTGGMCVDDKWQGNANSREVWRDTQIRVEGPAVRQMQAVFASNWLQTSGHLILGADYFPEIEPEGRISAMCFKSGPGEGAESARISYLLAIASARKSIDIEHAYFVPDDLAIQMLLEAAQRGVKIRVIIPEKNDSRFGRAAARSRWGELLAAGAEFYQYQPAMLHSKTMTVDDYFVTVGSVNFDNRSFSINDEIGFNILDESVALAHRKIYQNDLDHSKPYTRADHEGRPAYVKWTDRFCGLFRSQL